MSLMQPDSPIGSRYSRSASTIHGGTGHATICERVAKGIAEETAVEWMFGNLRVGV